MQIKYVEGAAPNYAGGETEELFYKVRDVEEIVQRVEKEESEEDSILITAVFNWIAEEVIQDQTLDFPLAVSKACKNLKHLGKGKIPTKRQLFKHFRKDPPQNPISRAWFAKNLVTKRVRSESGVLVVTVLTSPYPSLVSDEEIVGNTTENQNKKVGFSCKYDCFYCPNQPGQPRSYLRDEPAVLRANQNGFDPVLQFWDRCATLLENGHHVDKLEVLVLGGTWSSYPMEYREIFVRDLFFAANTFLKADMKRKRLDLRTEQSLNETKADCRIIGLTLETRPDCITIDEIRHFRRVGCTRVQLGIQHTDDAILKAVNRGCTTKDAIQGIALLKDSCFKVDAHLMPNLPKSSPEIDRQMLNRMASDPDLSVDQIKVYPCEIVPFTKIEKWFKEKTYIPYSLNELMEILIEFKSNVPPWIRLNRVVRDIPTTYQCASGVDESETLPTNFRNTIQMEMKNRGLTCKCIRCREYQIGQKGGGEPTLLCKKYKASNGTEYFISFENEVVIFGFCRLRISREGNGKEIFPELENAALVRELHVYGEIVPRSQKTSTTRQVQHSGFGTRLLQEAEKIVRTEHPDIKKMCVISGIGVREFYKSVGWYTLEGDGQFLVKDIPVINSIGLKNQLIFYSILTGALFGMVVIGSFRNRNQISEDNITPFD